MRKVQEDKDKMYCLFNSVSNIFSGQHGEKIFLIETSTYQADYDFEGQKNIALSGLWQLHIYFIVSDIKLEAMWKDRSGLT